MRRYGQFCGYCNRKTLHEEDDRGGTICGACGTITPPSAETIQARAQQQVSEEAIESLQASRRIHRVHSEQQQRNRFEASVGMIAIGFCLLLILAIVGGLAWIFTH